VGSSDAEVPDGIDVDAVTGWLQDRTELEAPLRFAVIQGGRSNLTYRVSDAQDRQVVLRRPPLHGVIESAHDMGREHAIWPGGADRAVPVPATVGFEPDDGVTGAPFYVMRAVDGVVVRDGAAARQLPSQVRAAASRDLVDVLARLHAVDPDVVGLGDLGRKDDYVARQLRRWHGQLQKTRTRDLPLLDDVHARLAADVPVQGPAAIVHGDYRLDNVIVDPATGQVRAVLDWELATLGDPLADVGLLHVYWTEADDLTIPLLDSPTVVEGFWSRAEVIAAYGEVARRDLDELPYFVALGYWKLACILEGVYSRYASGAYGTTDDSFRAFGDVILGLGERAADAVAEAGR
jgi:aminoglycoside phosphotransferase (APT) family kinase protein